MSKVLFALPVLALALIAAKPAAVPVAPPSVIVTPAEIAADPNNRLVLDLSTGGHVVIQLRPDIAPATVERIRTLTRRGFYDGLIFHRVIPGFMAQTGDPKGTGQGGSELPDLKAEFNALPHFRGTVSAARADSVDSANSQFFITFSPKFSLDHKYTAFGRVIEGMAAVDAIAVGEPPADPTRIVKASIGAPLVAPQVATATPTVEPTPALIPAIAEPAARSPEVPSPEPAPAVETPEPTPSGG